MASLIYTNKRVLNIDVIQSRIVDNNNISSAYKKLKLYSKALQHSNLSLKLSLESRFLYGMLESVHLISNIYEKMNETNLSIFFRNMHMKFRGNVTLNRIDIAQ